MLDVSKSRHIADAQERPASEARPAQRLQVVLVFQGGGALGAYQAGVYQALHEGGIEPDWIVGTSIGAINASLIAGNEPEHRLDRLEEFWRRMKRKEFWGLANWPGLADTTSYWSTLLGGIPGFFEPNPLAFLGAHYPLGRETPASTRRRRSPRRSPSWSTLRSFRAARRA
jgi:NTE family protein